MPSGITFIGPSPDAITLMGSKVKARELAESVGVPIVPGTEGGRHRRRATLWPSPARPAIPSSSKPAPAAAAADFASSVRMRNCARTWRWPRGKPRRRSATAASFIEKYIERPHHIEFQILADRHGNIIHLGERDCSIQRRHQKLIEIAPSLDSDTETARRDGRSRDRRLPGPSTTTMPEPSSSCSIRRAGSTSSK